MATTYLTPIGQSVWLSSSMNRGKTRRCLVRLARRLKRSRVVCRDDSDQDDRTGQAHAHSLNEVKNKKRRSRGSLESRLAHQERQRARRKVQLPTEDDSEEKLPDSCTCQVRLMKKARTVCRFLDRHYGLKRVRPLPSRIQCGHLRSAIRSTYPDELPTLTELTIKTAMKIEKSACRTCASGDDDKVREWQEERMKPVDVDDNHVRYFSEMFARNIPKGWNTKRGPFIPNGHATLTHTRAEGGNWNLKEGLEGGVCRPDRVWSSGKPRIVTLFPARYTAVLTPLHQSLYHVTRRKGWLLVGKPTNERVASLNGGGDWVSVDYRAATDNIKIAYLRAAVEVLKEKAVGLSHEEVVCLDYFANPAFDGMDCDRVLMSTGQPMGSVMSFPVLCLINKTTVDMALTDLLVSGEVSFKEWTSHRCLINGDDLLFREISHSRTTIKSRILKHGGLIGLQLNVEKTMVDSELGEINSTLFRAGVEQKKMNVASLYMTEVSDVLGYAAEASIDGGSFRRIVHRSLGLLRSQERKIQGPLPPGLRKLIVRDRKIRTACQHLPIARREPAPNPFPVVARPAGYDLSRQEEVDAIERAVVRLVDSEYVPPRSERRPAIPTELRQSVSKALRHIKPSSEDNILKVCADAWEGKRWDDLMKADPCESGGDGLPPGDLSAIGRMIDNIKAWKIRKGPVEKRPSGTLTFD